MVYHKVWIFFIMRNMDKTTRKENGYFIWKWIHVLSSLTVIHGFLTCCCFYRYVSQNNFARVKTVFIIHLFLYGVIVILQLVVIYEVKYGKVISIINFIASVAIYACLFYHALICIKIGQAMKDLGYFD